MAYFNNPVPEGDFDRRYLDQELRSISDATVLTDEPLTIEDWHEVGAAGEPAFENGWLDRGVEDTVAFYKDPFGVVRLRGEVDTGTNNTVIFTLPASYFTGKRIRLPATLVLTTALDRIIINAIGGVRSVSGTAGVSLNGISYRV